MSPRTSTRLAVAFEPDQALCTHDLDLRVRYVECDPMGFVHHSTHATWFEMGRTEMLRSLGGSYRELERSGSYLVVVDLSIRFQAPARYDDELVLRTHLLEAGRARLRHGYRLHRPVDDATIAHATTTLACVDDRGDLRGMPETILAATPRD